MSRNDAVFGISWPPESLEPANTSDWIPVFLKHEETGDVVPWGRVSPEVAEEMRKYLEERDG